MKFIWSKILILKMKLTWADFIGDSRNPIMCNIDEMIRHKPDYIFVVNPGLAYLKKVKRAFDERGIDTKKIIALR